ncbi:hypothetical protein HUU51_03660 [Candidatus Gracilibacteria bacterium]|nr:hypothetical protein [Candidatus Gracilibacteria bacterium]
MIDAIKVENDEFGKKESVKIDKSKIKDYFIGEMVEKEVKALNKDIDNKYKAGLLDFNGSEKISDSEKNKLLASLNELVRNYNDKIGEAVKEYGYASSANEKEIKQLLSSAGLNANNIKAGVQNIRENGIGNIAYYSGGSGVERRMKDAGL